MAIWTLHGDGKNVGADEIVAPEERLTWLRGTGAKPTVREKALKSYEKRDFSSQGIPIARKFLRIRGLCNQR
jgi:hypothetical protein